VQGYQNGHITIKKHGKFQRFEVIAVHLTRKPESFYFIFILQLKPTHEDFKPKFKTYRYIRLVIFPNSFGISPDKRFP
jgi:hypothetical protein